MKAKSWVIMFAAILLGLLLALAALNYFVDPFGVFGNMTWYSYAETLNPRVAKTEYLLKNSEQYDSYLVGCSSTSGFPKDALDGYLDASFYNTICYGADMQDTKLTVRWLLDNCTVKHIFLNVYIDNGLSFATGEDDISYKLHYAVSGADPVTFYGGYLFANPQYAVDKLKTDDTLLPQSFDVFDEQSGAYDKRSRDVENISDTERYLQTYPVFADYPQGPANLGYTDACMQQVAEIVSMCESAGAELTVVCAPVYCDYFEGYSDEAITHFYTALADVTDYWDFSYSSVSCEMRYFYDATHFRNDVGRMLLARIFGDEGLYVPADFGVFVTKENAAGHAEKLCQKLPRPDDAAYTAKLPVLTYHDLLEEDDGTEAMTAAVFEQQMAALCEAGYTAVGVQELTDYVYHGTALPEKPILITFDDGYLSNYELAYPILRQYGMKAIIFPIGCSVGKDTYKDTGNPICPHFSYAQAKQMIASGVIELGSHTFDLHQSQQYDTPPIRKTAGMLPGETQQEYAAVFAADLQKSMQTLLDETGQPVTALAYPEGVYTVLSQVICRESGVSATFTTEPRQNTLIKGLPQSLYGLGRFGVTKCSGEELLAMIS